MSNIVHVLKKDATETVCGEFSWGIGKAIDWEIAFNPDHPSSFSCGKCWKILAGNVEPMGGSLYLSHAHRVGENV